MPIPNTTSALGGLVQSTNVIYSCFRNITAIKHYKQEFCFNGIFQGESRLASFIGVKDDGSGGDNYS